MKLEFFRKLCELPFVQKIQLFGSRAKKKNRPTSDIDLIFYLDDENRTQNWFIVNEILHHSNMPVLIDIRLFGKEFGEEFVTPHEYGVNPVDYAKTLYQRP